ncbi:MAG: hypothetical protein HOB40_04985 [Candidatus Marinimicrobia bacterium]|jgi:hypothetical protein|nr:hypothetical protein [Candidatus Neomarinimicrobiota bacterium]MBT3838990.1 hypothetical protein [Candidatus Neomarinimicrobiota bacterium]MBT3999335.1 hypothetical protein [Candidatus Neomarinimicrobiota bacterium]MBT4282713.1 hypothetical protein [Candidatus Neomarinimicrobiota bacterium]MBT4578277.1 hypothetical protein [Candidatus Neomarinimicrobiota bacterium]
MVVSNTIFHETITMLVFGMVFFCPDSMLGSFESDAISPIQNAAGVAPFSFFPSSQGAFSDPTIIEKNQPLFIAGSYNRKFGLKSLSESLFVIGGSTNEFGLGFGISQFGNLNYAETLVSFMGSKNIKDVLIFAVAINYYQLNIKNYGNAATVGTRISLRYKMNSKIESIISMLNPTGTRIGQTKEKLPQIIIAGFMAKPTEKIMAQISLVQDTEFPVSTRFGLVYKLFHNFGIAMGKVNQPNIITTGGYLNWKNLQIEIGILSYVDLGLITYQTGISFTRIP